MKIKHLYLALLVFGLAFVSCKKDENKPTQQNDRKPLAVRTASGDIMSLVDAEKLTARLNASKDGENYIVESVEIVDKSDEEPYYFIINLLDIENEKSISCAYIGDYVEELSNVFYAVEDFEKGNYRVTDCKTGQECKFVNHTLVEPGEPTPCYTSGFWIKCEGEGCRNGTCKPRFFRCPDCDPYPVDPDNPPVCQMAGLGWGATLGVTLIPAIIGWIL